jgi:mitofilin
MIAAGRKNKITANNIELLVAEESANSAISILEKAKSKGTAIKKELKVMEDYRDLVESGREEFHREMESIMPDVKLGEKEGKLSEEELNMFITHAYKKVLNLQQEVARQQTLEQEKFKKALEKQKVDIQVGEAEKMDLELTKQAKEQAIEQERKMNFMKEELEKDIRSQLRRQAGAHSDHLQDMLSVQEAELIRNHQHLLSEELHNIRTSHLQKLAKVSGMVSGLSTSLQARQEEDKKSVKSQQLWIACSGIKSAMDTMKPLMGEVVMIKTSAMPGDTFVDGVLASLSPVALDRGVYSLNNLKERFCKVEKVARRVAWVGEGGGSLLSYGLSYLQSVLMVDMADRTPVDQEEEMNLSMLSQNEILTMTKHSLERNNLARAVQYSTMLKGEPSRVVSDWLVEARLTMETNQAVEALLAHSQGESLG